MSPQDLAGAGPGTKTPPGALQPTGGALGPVSTPFPAVCLLPAGSFGWPRPVVAIQRGDSWWRGSNGSYLSDDQVAGAERLVPVRPLRDLVVELHQLADDTTGVSEEAAVWVRTCADRLHGRLDSLTR